MRRKILLYLVPLALLLAGCGNEEEIRQREAEAKAKLEAQVRELNNHASLIQTLLGGVYFVKSVSALSDALGYNIVLSDEQGNSLTKSIVCGQSAEVGVAQDADKAYYWTLHGNWIQVGGAKVPATSSVTFKVEESKWFIRVEGGSWTELGQAATEITAPIKDVSATPEVVYFTLTNGVVLEVLTLEAATKLQIIVDDTAFLSMKAGESRSADYVVKAPYGVEVGLRAFQPDGYAVEFSDPHSRKGTLTVRQSAEAVSGKVMLVAEGSDGTCFVKVLAVGGGSAEGEVRVQISVDAGGGSLDLPSGAEEIQIPSSASWISLRGTQLVLERNDEYDSRSAIVSFKVDGRAFSLILVQAQKDALVLSSNSLAAEAEGEEIPFVLQANVAVEATSDVDWIQVEPATRAMEEKMFTVLVKANESEDERIGHLTFTGGDLSQTVTLTQQGRVRPAQLEGYFSLVTDSSELQEGDWLLIVNQEASVALGSQTTYNRSSVSIPLHQGYLKGEELPSSVALVSLQGSPGAWVLGVDGAYLGNADGKSNRLTTYSELSGNTLWTLSVSGEYTTIKATSGERNDLRYNADGAYFSCYSSQYALLMGPVSVYRKLPAPPDPVTRFEEPGMYLGFSQWAYSAGKQQYVRSYTDDRLEFAFLAPDTWEQAVVVGYASGMQLGDAVTLSVQWKMGKQTILSGEYGMKLLQEKDGKVWIGDEAGRGVILKK